MAESGSRFEKVSSYGRAMELRKVRGEDREGERERERVTKGKEVGRDEIQEGSHEDRRGWEDK